MNPTILSESAVRVRASNVGGIDETEVEIPPGVTVLSGRNATNRTSFLQALMAGLGSTRPSLKGDADEGRVELAVGDETYTRTLTRRGGSVAFDGDPYLDDPELADLFAFLLENNEARRAVARGDDLREIIMRPVDTDQIEADIRELEAEKDDIDARIGSLDELESTLPELETERAKIESDLEAARADLEAAQAAIDDLDADLEESRSRKEELEEAFQKVREARSEVEDLSFEIETEESTLAELRAERADLEETLDEFEPFDEDPERIDGRVEELRQRKRALDETLNELGSVISFNEEMLEGDGLDVAFESKTDGSGAEPGSVTDELLGADETVCWTCGSEVDRSHIDNTVDRLRDLRSAKLEERNDLRDQIDDLTARRSTIRQRRNERERAERRLDSVESEIADVEARIEELEAEHAAAEERVAEREADTEDVGAGEYDEVIERHREANELELKVDRLESDLAEVDAEIEETEGKLGERETLRDRREAVADELTDLRTRVDRIEEDAVEAFNEHMAAVLDVLGYENIDRIWIERRETEVREGRRKVSRARFDLHVVRSGPDGSAYRDTVDHLSESEREVTGLVFALAGYLVHDVHETLPFILLDSLEAIDSDRIAAVVEYLREYAGYLVVALLPEDAAAISGEHATVDSI
ncbi:archaea-specific SMC-related protein [Halorubrum trueperi]|uniref:Archaea-specific SMC-related protein n=1 Tax=Halorubrum trueperi TaxID=2004704 RepID=A0ABD5UHQ8_9EURY